jgi:AcrR family transcriptional regulator
MPRRRNGGEQSRGLGLTARQVRKEATRKRVLEAARELFETVGYDETTVRMIARAAGVSVGSVFTTFASKRDVLGHILHDRLEALHGELNRVAPQLRGSTLDRLRSIFAIHFAYVAQRPGLFLAYVVSTFDKAIDQEAEAAIEKSRLWQILHACLQDGRDKGEVCHKVDIGLIADLLIAAYLWTYRLVAREGADTETLSKIMDRHIGLIADGFTPRPTPAG